MVCVLCCMLLAVEGGLALYGAKVFHTNRHRGQIVEAGKGCMADWSSRLEGFLFLGCICVFATEASKYCHLLSLVARMGA